MPTPAAKRRRIDEASQTLAKPFRSPFKTPFKPLSKTAATPLSQAHDAAKAVEEECESANGGANDDFVVLTTPLAPKSTNTLLNRSFNSTSTHKLPASFTPRAPTSTARARKFTSPIQTALINADPEVAKLLKEQRELEKELRQVKEELDQAEQARKIERDSAKWSKKREEKGEMEGDEEEIDGELVVLLGKWKGASRMAAEELFGRVRDRVNRYASIRSFSFSVRILEEGSTNCAHSMGGPRAWKEMQKKQAEQRSAWDQEEPAVQYPSDDEDEDANKLEVEKRDLYAEYDIDPETENEKSQRDKGVGDTGELPGQEDEFTMAMMLRTLNVDLDVIGWCRSQQRWSDS